MLPVSNVRVQCPYKMVLTNIIHKSNQNSAFAHRKIFTSQKRRINESQIVSKTSENFYVIAHRPTHAPNIFSA